MTIHAFFFLLCALGICKAQSHCAAIPSLGQFVQVGANFTVLCIIRSCKGNSNAIFQNTNIKLDHRPVNGTAILHEVLEITENRTYTCKCQNKNSLICGVDIFVGHLPEVPQNLTCEQNGEFGNVSCTCETGKETGLWTPSNFRVRTASPNSTDIPVTYPGINSVIFHPGSETQFIVSAWASNRVGHSAAVEVSVTLSQIVRPTPPVLAKVECSSRLCHLLITSVGSCRMLEVQHRQDQGHWATQLFYRTDSNHNWNMSVVLEPFVFYHFRARLKLRPHLGLWSQWSSFNQHWTEEEAPMKKLDVWYLEESSRSYILLWKKLNQSEARGVILGYTVSVEDTQTEETWSWNVTNTTFTTLCSHCVFTVSAFNSKGYSPPADIYILHKKDQPPQNVTHVPRSDGSIALFWQKPATAAVEAVTGYLVEWLLVNEPHTELQWRRISSDQLSINITGLQPHQCYKGTVYALFKEGRGKAEIYISTQPKVPVRGPNLIRSQSLVVVDNSVVVTWIPVPRQQWRGCLKNYTIYVEGPKGEKLQYDVKDLMSRSFSVHGLIPDQQYKIFMTASTEAGESPPGEHRSFTFKATKETLALVFVILVTSSSVVSLLLILLCLCHVFSLCQRFLACCHLLPDMIPDPANSKWAKECLVEKGEMNFKLYLSDSSISEEEPDTLEVQEIPSESLDPDALEGLSRASSSSLQQDVCITYTLNSPSTYLKSFSHESDQTQESQNTEMTVDYISTHGMMSGESDGEEEEEEEEEEDKCMDGPTFLPCPLFDPQVFVGGKLTLDSVKIDCCSFLDESFFLPCTSDKLHLSNHTYE